MTIDIDTLDTISDIQPEHWRWSVEEVIDLLRGLHEDGSDPQWYHANVDTEWWVNVPDGSYESIRKVFSKHGFSDESGSCHLDVAPGPVMDEVGECHFPMHGISSGRIYRGMRSGERYTILISPIRKKYLGYEGEGERPLIRFCALGRIARAWARVHN